MEEYFIVPRTKIETAWNPPNETLEFFLLEYCVEFLGLPLYLIRFIYMSNEGIEIVLHNIQDWMIGEPWYVNLFEHSTYAKVA